MFPRSSRNYRSRSDSHRKIKRTFELNSSAAYCTYVLALTFTLNQNSPLLLAITLFFQHPFPSRLTLITSHPPCHCPLNRIRKRSNKLVITTFTACPVSRTSRWNNFPLNPLAAILTPARRRRACTVSRENQFPSSGLLKEPEKRGFLITIRSLPSDLYTQF